MSSNHNPNPVTNLSETAQGLIALAQESEEEAEDVLRFELARAKLEFSELMAVLKSCAKIVPMDILLMQKKIPALINKAKDSASGRQVEYMQLAELAIQHMPPIENIYSCQRLSYLPHSLLFQLLSQQKQWDVGECMLAIYLALKCPQGGDIPGFLAKVVQTMNEDNAAEIYLNTIKVFNMAGSLQRRKQDEIDAMLRRRVEELNWAFQAPERHRGRDVCEIRVDFDQDGTHIKLVRKVPDGYTEDPSIRVLRRSKQVMFRKVRPAYEPTYASDCGDYFHFETEELFAVHPQYGLQVVHWNW